jgi:hypothetical protein
MKAFAFLAQHRVVGRFCQFVIRKTGGAVVGSDQLGQRMISKGTTRCVAGSVALTNATMAFFEKVE